LMEGCANEEVSLVIDDDIIAGCDAHAIEADRDDALCRSVRVNVCETKSFQGCVEDIVCAVASALSDCPVLPDGVDPNSGEFVPRKHCAVRGCRWGWHHTAESTAGEGDHELSLHLAEEHAGLFKHDDKSFMDGMLRADEAMPSTFEIYTEVRFRRRACLQYV